MHSSFPRIFMSVPPPESTATRHPRFYYPNGSLIFRAEDTLYKLVRDTLVKDSEVFSDMLTLGVHFNGPGTEGTIDEDPIILPLTVKQFDLYLEGSCG